jgi:hypothetical protein
MTANWGVQDPTASVRLDDKKLRIFRDIYFQLERWIRSSLACRLHRLAS